MDAFRQNVSNWIYELLHRIQSTFASSMPSNEIRDSELLNRQTTDSERDESKCVFDREFKYQIQTRRLNRAFPLKQSKQYAIDLHHAVEKFALHPNKSRLLFGPNSLRQSDSCLHVLSAARS